MIKTYHCYFCEKTFDNHISRVNHARWHNVPKYRNLQKRAIKRFKLNKDRIVSQETKKKISKKLKGRKFTKEHRQKIGRKGKKHWNWKGNNVCYAQKHIWVRKNKTKPELCEICDKNKAFEIVNIKYKHKNKNYSKNLKEYKWSCCSCHAKSDKRGERKKC